MHTRVVRSGATGAGVRTESAMEAGWTDTDTAIRWFREPSIPTVRGKHKAQIETPVTKFRGLVDQW